MNKWGGGTLARKLQDTFSLDLVPISVNNHQSLERMKFNFVILFKSLTFGYGIAYKKYMLVVVLLFWAINHLIIQGASEVLLRHLCYGFLQNLILENWSEWWW